MKKTKKRKVIKPINPVNAFILIAIVLILAATVIMVLNNQHGFDGERKPVISDYEIKVIIKTDEVDDYGQFSKFIVGEEFVISENNTVLGVVSSEPEYVGNIDGFFVVLKARGSYDAENGFMLNGNMYLAPGVVLNIYGDNSTHVAEIYSIDIVK